MMESHTPKSNVTQRDYKIVVVGHRSVGKSAIVVRFLTKRFIGEYQENFDMACSGVVEVDSENIQLNICDTSQKALTQPHIDSHFRWADAVVLVFSITDENSFLKLSDAITRLKHKILAHNDNELIKVPAIVVVGNKGDLDHIRQVPRSWGHTMADQLGCEFFETSASEGWSKVIEPPTPSPETAPRIHQHPRLRHVNSTELLQVENKVKTSHKSTEQLNVNGLNRFRRKSAPIGNTILSLRNFTVNQNNKMTKGKENSGDEKNLKHFGNNNNDNNNNSIRVRRCPPLVAVPVNNTPTITTPKIDEIDGIRSKRSGSFGKNIMKKLSPRMHRRISNPHQRKSFSLPRHGESVARGLVNVGAALAFGTLRQTEQPIKESYNHDQHNSSSGSSGESPSKAPYRMFLEIPSSGTSDMSFTSSEDEGSPKKSPLAFNQDAQTTLKTKNVQIPSIEFENCHDLNIHEEEVAQCKEKPIVVINKPRYHPEHELVGRQMTFSEPFKYLCREVKHNKRKERSKSPSQFVKIRKGIRRIKTFAAEQHNNHSIKTAHGALQATTVRP